MRDASDACSESFHRFSLLMSLKYFNVEPERAHDHQQDSVVWIMHRNTCAAKIPCTYL
jgi:hypothetical protein